MCLVERGRDRSCCRASGLTPVHVVLVPPLLVLPLLVLPLLVLPLLVPLLLVPPLLVPPRLRFQALVQPLLFPRVVGSAAASLSGAGSAVASSSGAGVDGATSTASRLLFSGLHSEVSSSPAMVVNKKLRILLVSATALSSRRFFSRFFAAPEAYKRGPLFDGYITMKTIHILIAADTTDNSV